MPRKQAIRATIYPDKGRPVSRQDADEALCIVTAEQEKGTLVVKLRVNKHGAITLAVCEYSRGLEERVYSARIVTDREDGIRGIGSILAYPG